MIDVLTTIRLMTATFSELRNLKKQMNEVEFQKRIVDLQGQALEVIGELQRREAELLEARGTIADLKARLELQSKMVLVNNFFYLADSEGNPTGRAHCPNCWQGKKQAIYIHQLVGRKFYCPTCNAEYESDLPTVEGRRLARPGGSS